MTDDAWEGRIAAAWASIDEYDDDAFRAVVDDLAAELPAGHPVAAFERACAFDSTGRPDLAEPLYREALAAELPGERRRRAVIQLASTVRNLGRPAESVELLTAEQGRGSDHLDDAVSCVLALALTDAGREREAVSVAVGALARHLPRYQRSMTAYARALV
ncbi:tetratricopeptide repeat protein [Jiangella sp. DSM 45060]|uniref:tetratricopeptide repeat protein n=1 Tax=Jiangella sp. DSM 45060 TaxID=1798224 RepID=UPI000879F329|nr:tetratricopeptide repeat protein [Jiangella sp. DSM 45060]SDS18326.1 Tetratrico peptide repeat-containing protein [Jiangella sp. DSM 45060]